MGIDNADMTGPPSRQHGSLDRSEFERRFVSEVLIGLLVKRGDADVADTTGYVPLKDMALFRAVYVKGDFPDTKIEVLFSFAQHPRLAYGFSQKIWPGLDAWDDRRGRSIYNDPERAGMLFCVSFEEHLETERFSERPTHEYVEGPMWIRGSHR